MSTETTVVVENVGPARKRIAITIPASVVDAGLAEAFAAARTDAQIPGFRRGSAPVALIEKRFGAAITEDLKRKLLSEAYGKAVQDHKLQPISEPELDEKAGEPELRRGATLAVTLDVEVAPDIALPKLEDVKVRRPVADIQDKHIDDEVRRLGYRFGTPERIEGPFQNLDRMVGKAVVRVAGAANDPYFETGVPGGGPGHRGRGQGPGARADVREPWSGARRAQGRGRRHAEDHGPRRARARGPARRGDHR